MRTACSRACTLSTTKAGMAVSGNASQQHLTRNSPQSSCIMPSCLDLRSGAIHQAVDNIRTEGLALDREKEKTLRLRNDKGKALRKLENMALERKNRCGTKCIITHAPLLGL